MQLWDDVRTILEEDRFWTLAVELADTDGFDGEE